MNHSNHASTGGSCLDNPGHNSDGFPKGDKHLGAISDVTGYVVPSIRGSETDMHQNHFTEIERPCCRCGENLLGSHPYDCNNCGCVHHPDCVTDKEKSDYSK